jgi:hypothetical protein
VLPVALAGGKKGSSRPEVTCVFPNRNKARADLTV